MSILLPHCDVSECKIHFACACIHASYKPPCATHTPTAPAERLCDDCNILEVEEKVMHLEQDLKDARKAEREQVLDDVITAIENQKDHEEFLLSRDTKDIVEDIVDSLRGGGAP